MLLEEQIREPFALPFTKAGVPIESTPKRELEPFLVDNRRAAGVGVVREHFRESSTNMDITWSHVCQGALKSRSAGLRYRSARDLVDKNQARSADAQAAEIYAAVSVPEPEIGPVGQRGLGRAGRGRPMAKGEAWEKLV